MGKIDLTYINKQMESKKAAEAKKAEEKATIAEATATAEVKESKEIFGETYEEFHNRLEHEMEEARKALREIREMGF